jgi:hypothetical protein
MALFGKTAQPAQSMSDAEQLAQIMQGNLGGQLTGGDKLLALSALLRSVSRGRTQTPEQVFQGIQQNKAQEVQSRIQIDQLRKQAEQQAQLGAVKAQYIAQLEQTNPQLARAVQLMSADDFAKMIIEQNKPQTPQRLAFDTLGRPRDPYSGAIINPTARIQNLPTVASDEDYNALPSGTQFVDPEGNIRSKPSWVGVTHRL